MPIRSKLRRGGHGVAKADAKIVRSVAPPKGTVREKTVAIAGKLGDQPELRTLSAMVVAGGLLRFDRRLIRAGVRMLLAHELATLGKNMIKDRFDRTRPHTAKSHGERTVKPGGHSAKSETSFPSGHSAGATAVARAFGRDYPEQGVPALAGAVVVAAMQVPRVNHYPSDVAAGMLVGLVSEVVASVVVPALEGEVKREEPPPPPPPV